MHISDLAMQRKRIAVVANTTWNIYNFRRNILRKLVREGHEVIVMAPLDKFISYADEFPDIRHIPIRQMRRNSTNPFRDIRLFFELLRLYRTYQPEIILHYTVKCNIYGGFAAGWLGITSLAVITGVGHPFTQDGWLRRLVTFLYRQALPRHARVIFENQDDRAAFEAIRLIRPGQGLSVKGCGIDLNDFTPGQDERDPGVIRFSFIGRLIYDKGVREFVEAIQLVKATHRNIQCWLIGDIDEGNPSSVSNEDLMHWIRDPDIHYHGATENVKTYFRQSDCIVLPSYPAEGLPKVIMEAMAMARPVISTMTPGCREAVDDGITGFLIPPRDVEQLAAAMECFLRLSCHDRDEMGRRGRMKAEKEFDERIIVEQLYACIVEAGSTPPAA